MDGFQLHNIRHMSPSSINMRAEAPCAWIATKLLGRRLGFSSAATCGVCVENGVVNALARGMSADSAIAMSESEFDRKTRFNTESDKDKRREAIRPMIEQALQELKTFGTPEFAEDSRQKKIELTCNGDGWKIPIIGFIDLHFPDHGLIVDLKTTFRAPSELSDSHDRQASIYQKAFGNQHVKFLYLTPKKALWHEPQNVTARLSQIKMLLIRQERLLRLTQDPQKLADIIPVSIGSYYWNDLASQMVRTELYGL